MIKSTSICVLGLAACMFSCKKEKIPQPVKTPQTYGEKITGTWNCDSVIRFDADTNFISKTTDPVTYKYTPSSEGADHYDWARSTSLTLVLKMEESSGVMYQVTMGESTYRWQIRHIDAHSCYLYRPTGTFFPYIEKIYLSR